MDRDLISQKFIFINQLLNSFRIAIDHARSCNTSSTNIKKQLDRQLGELAKAALNKPQEGFRLSQTLVEQYLGEEYDDQSLCCLALRLGLLNRVGKDRKENHVFAFYHTTFQEYFAALTIDDWDYFLPRDHVNFPVEGKEYRIFEPQWKQVILLWLGREDIGNEKKEEFIQALMNFEDRCGDWSFDKVDRGFYEYRAYFLATLGIIEFKTCSLADVIVRQLVKWGFGYFNEETDKWQTFLSQIADKAREILPEINKGWAIQEFEQILKYPHCPESIRIRAAESLGKTDPNNLQLAIDTLIKILEQSENVDILFDAYWILQALDPNNPSNINAFDKMMKISEDESEDENVSYKIVYDLGEVEQINVRAMNSLIGILETDENQIDYLQSGNSLMEIVNIIVSIQPPLENIIYKNKFNLFDKYFAVLWNITQRFPYQQFYQAWHYPPTTPHPEVTEQTPVGHNSTVASLETQQIDICKELQNLAIFCLKAHILAAETRESKIAATLCQLIWDKALPDVDYPEEVTTPSDLRKHLKQLKRNQKLPKLAILLTDCDRPTPELITFCHKLTNILSIVWLTHQPLEAPLKGFPPDQPNLLSAIQTWLEEI